METPYPDRTEAAQPKGYSKKYSWYVLMMLMLVFAFSHMDRNIIAILLDSIIADMGLTDTQGGLVAGLAFAVPYIILGVPIARLADRFNRTFIITISLSVWSLMTAVCAATGNFWQLFLARMGVGAGEAGCVPPSQSIIADYFPKERRAFALSVFGLGVPLGMILGFGLGGPLNDWIGWQWTFVAVGLPGLALAVLLRMTVREPLRGYSDQLHHIDDGEAPSFGEVLKYLASRKSLLHMTVGAALISFGGYGSQTWIPAFFERSHGLSSGQIGPLLLPAFILGGIGGTLLGGWLGDKFGARDARWYMFIPAFAILPAVPVSATIMLLPNTTYEIWGMSVQAYILAVALMTIPGAAYTCYLGPTNAMLQQMVGVRMRATTVAVFLLITNSIGLGLGPLLIGVISDLLEPYFGQEALRYAMLGFLFIYIWAAFHFIRAARTIRADLEKAA